jgi:hypothetical protein
VLRRKDVKRLIYFHIHRIGGTTPRHEIMYNCIDRRKIFFFQGGEPPTHCGSAEELLAMPPAEQEKLEVIVGRTALFRPARQGRAGANRSGRQAGNRQAARRQDANCDADRKEIGSQRGSPPIDGGRAKCRQGRRMKPAAQKPQRCAIYTRKSTEHNLDLAFNSLDAQCEACEAYINSQAHEGWRLICDKFDDGVSGASLERPALQALPMRSDPERSTSLSSVRSTG